MDWEYPYTVITPVLGHLRDLPALKLLIQSLHEWDPQKDRPLREREHTLTFEHYLFQTRGEMINATMKVDWMESAKLLLEYQCTRYLELLNEYDYSEDDLYEPGYFMMQMLLTYRQADGTPSPVITKMMPMLEEEP